jgi:Zn-dependent alcohol dehydrogenase
VVEEVGPNTTGVKAGDHIVFSFMPVCGRCRWCSTGHQNLCDLGALLLAGSRYDDPTSYRMTHGHARRHHHSRCRDLLTDWPAPS